MNESKVRELLQWAAAEGWNPGLEDVEAFYATDPDGFYFAADGPTVVVAGISIVQQNDAHAFLGLYICKPGYRGRGIAFDLWKHAMKGRSGMTIGLDGVVAQQDNYHKSGFQFAWRNIRCSGSLAADNCSIPPPVLTQPVRIDDLPELIGFDAAIGGLERRVFLTHWLNDTATRKTIVLKSDNNRIAGFATIRQCQDDFKIGPLLASSAADAKSLIVSCAERMNAQTIIIDIPEPNETARNLAQELGLVPIFETARMYLGRPPDVDLCRLFGVATLELG